MLAVLFWGHGIADAQLLRNQQSPLQSIDRSLIERLTGQRLGPSTSSQQITSPVDSGPNLNRFESGFNIDVTAGEPSRLEEDYFSRLMENAPEFAGAQPKTRDGTQKEQADTRPKQFGYRLLEGLRSIDPTATGGAVNGSYMLGIGDEIVITFRGQVNNSYRTSVDREGQVILPDMPPVPAAGLTFQQFRAELARRTKAVFAQTDVFASIGKVRNFPVMVVGQVSQPGVHRVTGVASVLDALVAAGGILKSGTLRDVRVVRGKRVISIDIYDLLLTGRLTRDISLMEGDRVFVPSIGQTYAVLGDVQRPGIYELKGRSSRLSAARALGLSGGTLRPRGYRYLLISTQRDGADVTGEITDLRATNIKPGDMILVSKISYGWRGAFFVDGHVSAPGPRSLRRNPTIASVISTPNLLRDNPYTLFAILQRTDTRTRARHFLGVDLESIMSGKSDARLRPNDRLIVLGMKDIKFISSERVQAILNGRSARQNSILNSDAATLAATRSSGSTFSSTGEPETTLPGQTGQDQQTSDDSQPALCSGLSSLADVVARSRTGRFASAQLSVNPELTNAIATGVPCAAIFDRYPGMLPFLLDFSVAINGEVRTPGIYPIAINTPLANLIPIVGGLAPEADLSLIELTRFGIQKKSPPVHRTINARKTSLVKVSLNPGDIIRFSSRFSNRDLGSVFVSGEFKRPGVYYIRRGEKFSDIIKRAGGMTDQAYPLGTVFTRVRVREQEKKSFERAALDLQSGLAETLSSGAVRKESTDPNAVVLAVRELANTLRNTTPVGRVVVEADPNVLQVRPEFDTVLEPGDRIVVPKRPNHVTVSGEVLNPGAIQFRAGKSVDQYVKAAGGVNRVSDDGRIFVVFPNGEAKPVSVSSWNFSSVQIPPGSTIVVPRDPKPFDLMTFTISMADILSKLAISAASIAIIGRN